MKKFKLFGALSFTAALVRCLVLNIIPFDFEHQTLYFTCSYSLMAIGTVFFLLSALNAKGIRSFARVMQFVVMGAFLLNVTAGVVFNCMHVDLIENGNYETLSVLNAISMILYFLTMSCSFVFLFVIRMRTVWKILIPIFAIPEFILSCWGFSLFDWLGWSFSAFNYVVVSFSILSQLFWILAFATYPINKQE